MGDNSLKCFKMLSLKQVEVIGSSSTSANSENMSGGEISSSMLSCDSGADMASMVIGDIKITPKSMIFRNAFEGKSFHKTLTLTNVGKYKALVKIGSPTAYAFHIKALKRPVQLAPGMSISRKMTYTYNVNNVVHRSHLILSINNMKISYNIFVNISKALLYCPKELDFGIVNLGISSEKRVLEIQNDGTKGTSFHIDAGRNELNLQFDPVKGDVGAKSSVKINIKACGTKEGVLLKEFWIKTLPPLRVQARLTVIRPQLMLYHPNSLGDLALISFPPVFCGDQKESMFVLKNISSRPCTFLVLADINKTFKAFEKVMGNKPSLNGFTLTPTDGVLEPFEGKIFTVRFLPKKVQAEQGWKSSNKDETDNILFLRIINVDVAETAGGSSEVSYVKSLRIGIDMSLANFVSVEEGLSDPQVLASEIYNTGTLNYTEKQVTETVHLCLYGDGENTNVSSVPDELNFGHVDLNIPVDRVLCLQNNSASLTVRFKYQKLCNIFVDPACHTLKHGQCIEVGVRFIPTSSEIKKMVIIFELFPIDEDGQVNNVVVGYTKVPVYFNMSLRKGVPPKPKFVKGIVPLITNEVGICVSNVKFKNISELNIPKTTMAHKELCPKHPSNIADECYIAFPNDRQRSLRPTNPEKIFKTIFTGTTRYIYPPDLQYNLSTAQREAKERNDSYYMKYMRSKAKELLDNRQLTLGIKELPVDSNIYKICRDSIEKTVAKITRRDEQKNVELDIPRDYYCIALNPYQLYNIRINPKIINLGKIAAHTACSDYLLVENINAFKIKVDFQVLTSQVTLPNGLTYIIGSRNAKRVNVTCIAEALGRFSGVITYVINDSHKGEITISANIVQKSLTLSTNKIFFDNPNELFAPKSLPIEIINPFYSLTSFQWNLPSDCCYEIHPSEGTVSYRGRIICFVYIYLDPLKKLETDAIFSAECGETQIVNISANLAKARVHFLESYIELKVLSLNLLKIVPIYLVNDGNNDVIFHILTPNPMNGVEISPIYGVIHGKSSYPLFMYVKLKFPMKFNCKIKAHLQRKSEIHFNFSGQVVCPQVRFRPDTLKYRRISSHSFDVMALAVENYGKTEVCIQIQYQGFSEFNLCFSKDGDDEIPDLKKISLSPGEILKLYLYFKPIDLAAYEFYLPVIINSIIGPPIVNSPESLKQAYYLSKYARLVPLEQNILIKSFPSVLSLPNFKCLYIISNYKGIPHVSLGNIPTKMPLLKVTSVVSGNRLQFSQTAFNFCYLPLSDQCLVPETTLTIKNQNHTTENFAIRIADLSKNPFGLEYVSGPKIEIRGQLMLCSIGSNEKLILKATFRPENPGLYSIKAPIYLEKNETGDIYNILSFQGRYPKPLLQSESHVVLFEPVPLGIAAAETFILDAYNYTEDSILTHSHIQDSPIDILYPNGHVIKGGLQHQIIPIKCRFRSQQPSVIRQHVEFTDGCGNKLVITLVARADNCLLTTLLFLESKKDYTLEMIADKYDISGIKNEIEYPLLGKRLQMDPAPQLIKSNLAQQFPSVSELSEHLSDESPGLGPSFHYTAEELDSNEYLKETYRAVELWMYEGALKGEEYLSIPVDFVESPEKSQFYKLKPAAESDTIKIKTNITRLLERLAGPEVLKYFNLKMPVQHKDDNIERVNFYVRLFAQVLNFLQKQNGLVTHISPLCLLCYKDYKTYKTQIMGTKRAIPEIDLLYGGNMQVYSEEQMKSRTRISWAKVILQIYKTLVLSRVTVESLYNHRRVNRNSKSFEEDDIKLHTPVKINPLQSNVYSIPERILLAWLNSNYETQREKLWNDVPPHIQVKNFSSDLDNSLVLIAVTATYCSYLTNIYFSNLYMHVTSVEMAYHNASKLVEAWRKIRLGFTITPNQLVRPNSVRMLFLVNYLYETLPSYLAQTIINFTGELAKTVTKNVNISTMVSRSASYVIEFIGNENEYFKVDTDTKSGKSQNVRVVPKKETVLPICFLAKKLLRVKVVLILCGDVKPGSFSQNIVFILQGEPYPLTPTSSFYLPSPIYESNSITLDIYPPYFRESEYDIHYTQTEPETLESLNMYSWGELKFVKIPRRPYIENKTLRCVWVTPQKVRAKSEIIGKLNLNVTCALNGSSNHWVIFTSPIGDFIVTISIVSNIELTTKVLDVCVRIPITWPLSRMSTEQSVNDFCICTSENKTSTCPFVINVPIPIRNEFLWQTFFLQFKRSLEDEVSKQFWKKHFHTKIGQRLVEWIIENEVQVYGSTVQQDHIFKTKVTYNITTDRPDITLIRDSITINNVRAHGLINIPTHILSLEPFCLTMTSDNHAEYRKFHITFVKK